MPFATFLIEPFLLQFFDLRFCPKIDFKGSGPWKAGGGGTADGEEAERCILGREGIGGTVGGCVDEAGAAVFHRGVEEQ